MEKPSYGTTKRMIWISLAMAWGVILTLALGAALHGQAVEFGTIAVPSMVGLIVAMLGIHRGFGSLDYRAAHRKHLNTPSVTPYNPRDNPAPSGDAR